MWFNKHGTSEPFPWIAVDLVTTQVVTAVEINVPGDNYLCRVKDLEFRVGEERPFQPNTNGDVLYTSNRVCAEFPGPALTSTTKHVCGEPLIGRYVTMQRVKENTDCLALALFEMNLETKPAPPPETIEILLRAPNVDEAPVGQCPKDLSFAYAGGLECCESNLSNHPSEGLSGWELEGLQGRLHYDSPTCFGNSQTCDSPPCLNYNFQR